MAIYKTCDLCRKEHDNSSFFIKLKEEYQTEGVTDVCEVCYEILENVFNIMPNTHLFNTCIKSMLKLSDWIHGV